MGEAEEQVGGPFAGAMEGGDRVPSPPVPAEPSPRRRWPRRLALAAALTPPLLWGTREWTVHPALIALAPWAAEQVGATLELEGLESDWWSSLRVDGLRFAGGSLVPVAEAVEVEAARLRWDMGRLVRGEVGWLQQVELVRPQATLDLTSPSPDDPGEGAPAELPAVLPDLRLVGGGLTLRLPANVTVSNGPIRFGTVQAAATTQNLQRIDGAIVSLPDGPVSIAAAGDVTMAGLSGMASDLTLRAGTGRILIGSQDGGAFLPDPARKIAVRSLTVPQAGSANLYGSVAGQFGPQAAYIVGPLTGAPYFINDTPWGPPPATMVLPPAINPPAPPAPPSTPQADALFNLQTDPAGINPDALAPFTPPNVLQVTTAPVTLTPPPAGGTGADGGTGGTSEGAPGGGDDGSRSAPDDDDDETN